MTVRDGFKFGIGYITAKYVFSLTCNLLDKKSKMRKELDHAAAEVKELLNEPPVTTE